MCIIVTVAIHKEKQHQQHFLQSDIFSQQEHCNYVITNLQRYYTGGSIPTPYEFIIGVKLVSGMKLTCYIP